MEKRIEALEITVTEMKSELKEIREVIGDGFKKIDRNFELISKEIDHINIELKHVHNQIDQLNQKVDILKGDTNEGFVDVKVKLDNLTGEITKIGKVTNYSDYFDNLNSIN